MDRLPNPNRCLSIEQLFDYYQRLFQVRKESEALRRGEFKVLATDDEAKTIVFARRSPNQTMLIAINRGDVTATINLPTGYLSNSIKLQPVVSSDSESAEALSAGDSLVLTIPAQTGQIWQAETQR